jgi:hypothetical protein
MFDRRRILSSRVEHRDGFREYLLLRHRVEQCHGREEFHVVRGSQEFIDGLFARLYDKAGAFDQAGPEQVVAEIGDGLGALADREALGHGAETKAGNLGKDEPHPVGPLPAA